MPAETSLIAFFIAKCLRRPAWQLRFGIVFLHFVGTPLPALGSAARREGFPIFS